MAEQESPPNSGTTMRAAVYHAYGDPESEIRAESVPIPDFGASELLIKVQAAALNPVDLKRCCGNLRLLEPSAAWPRVLGFDVAGEVVEVGAAAARAGWEPGERAFAMCDFPRRGAVAEYAVVGHTHAARVLGSLPWTEAASLPLVASTSIMGIDDTLRVRSGERLLILGGTTATGLMAIQIAKARGAHVTVTCGASSKAMVEALGADEAVDYKAEEELAALHGARFDAIYDTVDGETGWTLAKQVLTSSGRFATIAIDEGGKMGAGAVSVLAFRVARRLAMHAVGARPSYWFVAVSPSGEHMRRTAELVQESKLRAVVDASFALEDGLAQACARVASGRAKGKVVVTITAEATAEAVSPVEAAGSGADTQ